MCTYLPIGELLSLCWFMLENPHMLPLPSPPTLFVRTPSTIPCAARCEWRQSRAPLSLLSTQSGLQGKQWIYLWEEFRSIIYSHWLSSKGRLYCIFMNDPVYECTQSSCFNVTQERRIAVVRKQRSLTSKCLMWTARNRSAFSVYWAVCFWSYSFPFSLSSYSLLLSLHLSQSTQA